MAEETQFTIPLRKEFSKAPSYKRSEKAIKAIREFIERHMKTDNVKIGKNLNLKIFERGRKNPPPRIKVKAVKEDKLVRVELPEFPFDIKVEKKEKKKEVKAKETEKIEEGKEVKEIKEESKKEEKLEVKEVTEKPIEEKLDKDKSKKTKK